MSNAVFPVLPGLAWSVQKTPNWATQIQRSVNGRSLRAARYANPIWKFHLTYEFLRAGAQAELQSLMGFFNLRQGAFDSFLYSDPDDHTCLLQPFGIGNGVTTTYNLLHTSGGFTEPIGGVQVSPTPLIYVGGILYPSGYTIDMNAGTITFSPAPTGVLTWSGSFYFRCCFVKDSIDFDQFMKDLWNAKKVELESVR